jgi:hypothetical protein
MSAIDHDKLEAIIRAKRGLRAYITSRKVDAVCSTINSITALSLLDSIEGHYLASREEARQLRAERERLREALSPSCETKAAYIGEFHFEIEERDEDGNELARKISVPWTTTKEIMAAILERAALSPTFDQRDYGDERLEDDGFITAHPRPHRDGPGLDVKELADIEGRN